MSRKDTIIKNTIAYTIGNLGTKVLSYVMVLVYTHYISTSDLGYYDLILTTISMLQPLVTLMLDDGVYRWLIDAEQKNKARVISTCFKATNITSIITIFVFLLINVFFRFRYAGLIVLYFYSTIIYQIILNAVRGLSNSRLYAKSGILNSSILLICEVIGLVALNYGVEALIGSAFISNTVAIAYIYIKQPEFHHFIKEKYDSNLLKNILKYTLPLIPNNICWWIVNSSDRYIILYFLGTSYNGIYSISNKFPTVITTITGIFYYSLQETILKEYHSPDRDEFYSKIFKQYYKLLFGLVLCGTPITRFVIQVFVSTDYRTAWQYTGILYLSTVYSALSSLLGIGYQISRETKRSVKSTIFSAVINFAVNVILINKIGLYAACISTLVAYIFLFVIRIYHSKRYFNIKINWKEFIGLGILCLVIIIATYFINNNLLLILLTMLFTVLFLYNNIEIVKPIMLKLSRGKK